MPRGGKREGAGRPQGSKDQVLPDEFIDLGPAAISVLKSKLEDKDLKTAMYVLDHIHGKPTQRKEISGPDGSPVSRQMQQLTDDIFAPSIEENA